jgi:Uma2 family endonuclease
MATNAPPITKTSFTYDDYAKLPEGAPYQLVGGELIMSPSPTFLHQMVLARLFNLLFNFVTSHSLGVVVCAPMDVYFSESETFQPDILFVARDRMQLIGHQRIEGAPDLIVEILSPSGAYYDLKHKKRVYESFGVKEYWIVDPMENGIEVYRNVDGQFHLTAQAQKEGRVQSNLLSGFEVDLNTLFN